MEEGRPENIPRRLDQDPLFQNLKNVSQPDLNLSITFSQNTVKTLRDEDFETGSDNKITLKNKSDSFIVLFYISNQESLDLAKIWLLASQQAGGGIKFAACNLTLDTKIDTCFRDLNMQKNHPYYWARLKTYPFSLVYRSGVPSGFYAGERSVRSIINFALTRAFSSDFNDKEHNRLGVQVDNNFAMGGYIEYKDSELPPGDLATNADPVGYDTDIPVFRVGSPEEERADQINKEKESNAQQAAAAAEPENQQPAQESSENIAQGNQRVASAKSPERSPPEQ